MPATSTGLLLDRVAPESRHKLETQLSQNAASALRLIGVNRLLQPVLDPTTKAELIAAGYGADRLGGFKLSDTGMIRAMMENGQ